jgi:hypothetical protein
MFPDAPLSPLTTLPRPLTIPARRRPHWLRRAVLILVVLVGLPFGVSYGRALTKPGTDSLSVRSVEWVRDHGGSHIVAWVENEWYSHHPPPKGGLPKTLPTVLPPQTVPAAPTQPARSTPGPVRLLVPTPVPGEGLWRPTGRAVGGAPVLYTTFMRPDNVHTSLLTGLAWIDTSRVRFELWSGTSEPGGSGWHLQAPIPYPVRPELIAAFNSGFRLSDSHGGYYAEGRMVKPLVAGQASMVFHADGRFDVGQWGRDFTLKPDVVAVRQNLVLLVDHGQPAPDLNRDSLSRWGFTVQNKTLVWRSGVGVDARGNAIYAAGNGLSVQSLANVLLAAGAVRAMELDINSSWTHFFSYHDDSSLAGGTASAKLLPDMAVAPDRYFHPSSRDFVSVFARKPS